MNKVEDESPHLAETGTVEKEPSKKDDPSMMKKAKEGCCQSKKTRMNVIGVLLFLAVCTFLGVYLTEPSDRKVEAKADSSVSSNPFENTNGGEDSAYESPNNDETNAPAPVNPPTKRPTSMPTVTAFPTVSPTMNPFQGKARRLFRIISRVSSNQYFYMDDETVNTKAEYLAWKWISEQDQSRDTRDECEPSYKVAERYAAAVLYYATNGENWSNQYNFLSDKSICEWNDGGDDLAFRFGVNCTYSWRRMDGLQLASNNLEGSLPASIGMLAGLTSLDLRNNEIEGTIPSEVSRLTMLSDLLDLSYNNLSGSIPTTIGALSNLGDLSLQHNGLDGTIPDQIVSMQSLTSLNLASNRLTGKIPFSFGLLGSLYKIHFQKNKLTGDIPTSLSGLKKTDEHKFNLYLHDNTFDNGASMEFLCQDNNVCTTTMACSSDCQSGVQCSCCRQCDNSSTSTGTSTSKCEKVSPSPIGCRIRMDDNINKQSSVLQVKNVNSNSMAGADFPFAVMDKININSEATALTIHGSIPVNGGPISYKPSIGVPDVTCDEMMSDDWYAMKDDGQLRFTEEAGYPCTEFGERIIYRLIMDWLYFG